MTRMARAVGAAVVGAAVGLAALAFLMLAPAGAASNARLSDEEARSLAIATLRIQNAVDASVSAIARPPVLDARDSTESGEIEGTETTRPFGAGISGTLDESWRGRIQVDGGGLNAVGGSTVASINVRAEAASDLVVARRDATATVEEGTKLGLQMDFEGAATEANDTITWSGKGTTAGMKADVTVGDEAYTANAVTKYDQTVTDVITDGAPPLFTTTATYRTSATLKGDDGGDVHHVVITTSYEEVGFGGATEFTSGPEVTIDGKSYDLGLTASDY